MDYRDTTRRLIATLAFRTRHALKNAPTGFEDFEAGMDVRTPHQIIHHMNDCVSMTNDMLSGRKPERLEVMSFMETVETFHEKMSALDKTLADVELPDDEKCLRILQGPLCDAMTHVGQLMMIRRLMGASIPGATYYRSDIKNGQVGPNQPLPED
jgi:hypothetical protein